MRHSHQTVPKRHFTGSIDVKESGDRAEILGLPDLSRKTANEGSPMAMGSNSKIGSNVFFKPKTEIVQREPWHSSNYIKYPLRASFGSSENTLEKRDSSLELMRDSPLSSRNSFSKNGVSKGRTTFALRGIDLAKPPKSIFRMTNLESLSLSPEREACLEYKLKSLPREIGNLQNLRFLALDTNELTELPPELSFLSHLETLVLSNNSLATLPEGFGKLKNVRSLHLANNRFTEFPIDICTLENLSFLDFTDNSIRKIPKQIERLAPSLQTLFLYLNDLEKLPDSFCKLENLTTLWLGKNRLRSLPNDFGNLSLVDWDGNTCSSNIDDNPLVRPPLSVCQNGIQAIKEYFEKNPGQTRVKTRDRSKRMDRKSTRAT